MDSSMLTKAVLLLITLFLAVFAMELEGRKMNHHHHHHLHQYHSMNKEGDEEKKTKTLAGDTVYQPTTVGAGVQTPPNFGSFPATTFPFPFPFPFFPSVTRPFTSNIPGNLPLGNLPPPSTVPGSNLPEPGNLPPGSAAPGSVPTTAQPGNLSGTTTPPFGGNLPFGFPPVPTGFPRITVSIPGIPAQFIAGIFGDNRSREP